MAFPITVRLYGTDTEPTASVATKTTLDTASTGGSPTVFYWEFDVQGIESGIVHRDENKTDISGKIRSKRKIRPTFNLKLQPKDYPTSATNLQAFYNTTVLSKKFHYFWFNSYTLPDSATANTQCLAVAITGFEITQNYETASKDIIITLEKMYSE